MFDWRRALRDGNAAVRGALRLLRKERTIGLKFRGEPPENVACYRTLCQAKEALCSYKLSQDRECGSILPPNKCKGYYELFKLEPSFDINSQQLYEQYKSFQKQTHPDGFSRMSEGDQLLAQQQSSFINEAYTALRNPLRRAEYLLKCRGKPLPSEGEAVQVDPALLMEVMELREAVEEASSDGELQGLRDQAAVEESLEALSSAFARNDLVAAQRAAVRLRYMAKVEEEISAREGMMTAAVDEKPGWWREVEARLGGRRALEWL
eukprot:jgi/Mesvir1/3739/Mv15015-RA.1